MPSWFHGIRAVIALLTAAVGLAGAVVGILIPLGVIGGERADPQVDLVSKTTVTVGEQIDLLGRDLDLVEGVQLTRGLQPPISLTFARLGGSQLTVTIPSSARPERYNLILVTTNGDTVATGHQLEVSSLGPAPTLSPGPAPAVSTPTLAGGPTATATAPSPTPAAPSPPSPKAAATPTFNPSGLVGLIAFTSDRTGDPEIYTMRPDGTGLQNLTNHPASDEQPAWSPDGRRLVFQSHRDGNWEIYLMNADGSEQERLTNNPADDVEPAWSPDGARIAFSSDRGGNQDIYIINVDGSGLTRLTDSPASDNSPAWSPDGFEIAFASDRGGAGFDVYVTGLEGIKQYVVAENAGDPAWSPDGLRIALESNINDDFELQVMRFDGSDRTRITSSAGLDARPSWSPGGQHLVFESERNGSPEIYLINADGANPVRLTNHPSVDASPAWSPQ